MPSISPVSSCILSGQLQLQAQLLIDSFGFNLKQINLINLQAMRIYKQ